MTSNEQQLLLQLLFRTRQRFSRHPGTERAHSNHVRCLICSNDWPEASRADYHTANCPVPACERMLLNDGVVEEEVYYPLKRPAAERGRELQPSEQNRIISGAEFVKKFPAGTPLAEVFHAIDEVVLPQPTENKDGTSEEPKLPS